MAMPTYSGNPFSRPEWEPAPRHRASKSISHTKHMATAKAGAGAAKKQVVSESKPDAASSHFRTGRTFRDAEGLPGAATGDDRHARNEIKETSVSVVTKADVISHHSPTDPKFDLSKITAHHAEGSMQVKKDRAEILPMDRKEQARRRLEERKKLRKNTST
jgi:hypothetical protein